VTTRAAVVDARRLPVTMLAAAVAVCGGSGCSDGGKPAAHSTSTETRIESARIPGVGAVVFRRGTGGLVIVDRKTGGKRLRLTGIQAGECRSYLESNPGAPASSVRAACPGWDGMAATEGAASTTTTNR
jgi:hypothetical protein